AVSEMIESVGDEGGMKVGRRSFRFYFLPPPSFFTFAFSNTTRRKRSCRSRRTPRRSRYPGLSKPALPSHHRTWRRWRQRWPLRGYAPLSSGTSARAYRRGCYTAPTLPLAHRKGCVCFLYRVYWL